MAFKILLVTILNACHNKLPPLISSMYLRQKDKEGVPLLFWGTVYLLVYTYLKLVGTIYAPAAVAGFVSLTL